MKIYLRPVTLEDGAMLVKWRNTPIVADHCFNKTKITLESNEKFYHTYVETGLYRQFIVERVEEDFGVASYSIATVYLKDIDRLNKRCELCIFTSDDQEWNTESQSIAICMLLNIAYDEYQMNKVYSYVFAKNEDEMTLLERSGFQKEALLKQEAVMLDGSFADVYRLCTIRKNRK